MRRPFARSQNGGLHPYVAGTRTWYGPNSAGLEQAPSASEQEVFLAALSANAQRVREGVAAYRGDWVRTWAGRNARQMQCAGGIIHVPTAPDCQGVPPPAMPRSGKRWTRWPRTTSLCAFTSWPWPQTLPSRVQNRSAHLPAASPSSRCTRWARLSPPLTAAQVPLLGT